MAQMLRSITEETRGIGYRVVTLPVRQLVLFLAVAAAVGYVLGFLTDVRIHIGPTSGLK